MRKPSISKSYLRNIEPPRQVCPRRRAVGKSFQHVALLMRGEPRRSPHLSGVAVLTKFMRQHKGCLVLDTEIPSEGEHALALHLVAKHHDGQKVRLQRQLMPCEQGPRCHREIAVTCLAAPTPLIAPMAIVAGRAVAMRATRFAIGRGPPQAHEHVFGAVIGHPHDLADAERSGCRGQEEMLRHSGPRNANITRTYSNRGACK